METKEDQNPFFSIHLPLTLISLALALYFSLNSGGAKQTAQSLEWQTESNKKQIENLTKQQADNAKSLEQNKAYVATAEQTQKQFGEIMKDLLEIAASGDKDAELIVKTYGIASTDSGPAVTDKKEEPKDEKKNP